MNSVRSPDGEDWENLAAPRAAEVDMVVRSILEMRRS